VSTPLFNEIKSLQFYVKHILKDCEQDILEGKHPDDLASLPRILLVALFQRIYYNQELIGQIMIMQRRDNV